GCAMIGTGLIFWMQARISKARPDPASVRVVRALGIASTTGIILATAGFLVANRLIPRDIALDGVHRHDLEILAFFLTWLVALGHAAVRGTRAWREQCMALAGMGALAVALNWITTGYHPVAAIGESAWSVLLMDMVLLAGAAAALWAATRLRRAGQ